MYQYAADILIFAEIVDAGSITGAAKRLARTKSAVSQSLRNLEAKLGITLFVRSTRRLNLTEPGERLYIHARAMRAHLNEGLNEAKDINAGFSGRLTVTMPSTLMEVILADVVVAYRLKHEYVSLNIVNNDLPLDLLGENIDLAFRVGATGKDSDRVRKIGEVREGFYIHVACAERFGIDDEIDLQGFLKLPHIGVMYQPDPIHYDVFGVGAVVEPVLKVSSVLDAYNLVSREMGVALLPEMLVEKHKSTSVKPLRVKGFSRVSPLYILHPYHAELPQKAKTFVQMVEECFAYS